MPTMITKPNNLFDKGELENKYRIFQDKTRAIQNEEEMKREREEALGHPRKGKKDPTEEELVIGGISPSKLMGANVMMSNNTHQLAVGKPKH